VRFNCREEGELLGSDEAGCPFETLGAWIVGKRRGLLKAAGIAAKAA
jgi:hypothetical protein